MSATMSCPGCHSNLRIRDDLAGKKIKCPRCGKVVVVPSPAEEATEVIPNVEDIATAPRAKGAPIADKRPCPACGEPIARTARQCRFCHTQLDEEDEDVSIRKESDFEPCPRCGETGARRVVWTFWGSFYGPAMFTHVRCPACGYTYNGRTGRSNIIPATIFVMIPLLLILGLLGFVGWIFHTQGYF